MKKAVAVLLVLMLVTFAGVGRVQGVVREVFCQVPLSVLSRSPADSFIIPIMAINKDYSLYAAADTYVRVQATLFNGSASSSSFTNPTFIGFAPYNQ
jgi:hypothetical protein